jgi:hypothetical protein
MPKRFDTRFYLLHVGTEMGVSDGLENVALEWVTPSDALKRHAEGTFPMLPPQILTLRELSTMSLEQTLKPVLVEPIEPVMLDGKITLNTLRYKL